MPGNLAKINFLYIEIKSCQVFITGRYHCPHSNENLYLVLAYPTLINPRLWAEGYCNLSVSLSVCLFVCHTQFCCLIEN